MPRILFLDDYDYKPLPQQTFSYKKGDIALVKQEVADIAISKGKAKITELSAPSSSIEDSIKKFPRKKQAMKDVSFSENLVSFEEEIDKN